MKEGQLKSPISLINSLSIYHIRGVAVFPKYHFVLESSRWLVRTETRETSPWFSLSRSRVGPED